jgi:hypothetical protein
MSFAGRRVILAILPRALSLFLAAAIDLLEQVAHDADKGTREGGQHHEQSHGSPQRAIGWKAGLKARGDQRHTRGKQGEEAECGGQDVEVAGHARR